MNVLSLIMEAEIGLIVVDDTNRVKQFNRYCIEQLGFKLPINEELSENFEEWEVNQEANVVHATFNNRNIILLKGNFTKRSDLNFYIVLEEMFENSLIHQVNQLKNINHDLLVAIENSYDGIYITDDDGKTIYTNTSIEKITGIPREYYIGKSVDSLIRRGILKDSVTHLAKEKKRSVSLVQKNFEGKEILLTGTPVFNSKNKVKRVVTNIRDLSDLNELQGELLKARKLNDKFKKELKQLKNNQEDFSQFAVVKSTEMRKIYETAERLTNIDITLLISGETGVGKDVLAKYIYNNSDRKNEGQFIKVNCGAIPAHLLESELFGYEAGAFTGANPKGKIGLFEAADKGILFLDEIGDLSIDLQVKLLRVLQENEVQRVGSVSTKKVDVRVIAATNRDLKEMVKSGEFREDLFYRLNVVPLEVPPLRERRDDILPLIDYFLAKINEKHQMNKTFNYELRKEFYEYDWPGNVRELSNLVERLIVTTIEDEVTLTDLPKTDLAVVPDSVIRPNTDCDEITPLKAVVESAERSVLERAVMTCKSTYEIAEKLEISQPTVVRKLKKYAIEFN